MFIRESLRQNKKGAVVAAGVLIAVSAWISTVQIRGIQNDKPEPVNDRAYYTSDDGATWFADSAKRTTPFDHNGRPAVKAYVWRCGGGKPFITYLERLNPEAKAKLDRLSAGGGSAEPVASEADPAHVPGKDYPKGPGAAVGGGGSAAVPKGVGEIMLRRDLQVKRPGTGENGWVKGDGPEGRRVARTACPDGQSGDLEPVQP